MSTALAVAFGGALGALGRYLVMSGVGHWLGAGFPFATLTCNVTGAFAMGLLVEASALVWSPSPELRALLTVGLLGGFTTFSAFSLEVVVLAERSAWAAMMAYVVVSVALSVAALLAGLAVMRWALG